MATTTSGSRERVSPRGTSPFGARLRALRLAARLSQKDLAARAGVSNVTVSQLERGIWRSPRPDTARLVADALGLAGPERDAFFRLAAAERVPRPVAEPPSALAPPGRFVGRERETAALLSALALPGPILVTVVGAGGVGKTRLAQEVAARVAGEGARRVAWVGVEALDDEAQVLPAVARALGLPATGEAPLADRVAARLRAEPTLLVLDNLEHLTPAAAIAASLLAAAPGTAVVLTTRQAARLPGEQLLTLDPLPLPPPGASAPELAASPAVALFLDRASAGQVAGGGADPAPLADAARVVTLVDGLPLAIELAAAQVPALSVAAIADLIADVGLGALDPEERREGHRFDTMTRALRWSHDLLDPDEQRLLRRLAPFRGGFAPAEVAAVAGTDAAALFRLVRASLVRDVTPAGGPARFALLEPVRQFAATLLADQGETLDAAAAHARACLAVVDRETAGLTGPDPVRAAAALEREEPNILAALAHATAHDHPLAAAMASRLGWWWDLRADTATGRQWLERIAAVDGEADPLDRLGVRWWAALMAALQWDRAANARWTAETVALADEIGTPFALGLARMREAFAAWISDGDIPRATERFGAAIATLEPLGPGLYLAFALMLRGNLKTSGGDPAAAIPDLRRALAIQQEIGNVAAEPVLRCHLAAALEAVGRWPEAAEQRAASLRFGDRLGSTGAVVMNLVAIADRAAGDDPAAWPAAARLLGGADALVERTGTAYGAAFDALNAATRARLAAGLGPARLAALESEGRALPAAELLAEALEVLARE